MWPHGAVVSARERTRGLPPGSEVGAGVRCGGAEEPRGRAAQWAGGAVVGTAEKGCREGQSLASSRLLHICSAPARRGAPQEPPNRDKRLDATRAALPLDSRPGPQIALADILVLFLLL